MNNNINHEIRFNIKYYYLFTVIHKVCDGEI